VDIIMSFMATRTYDFSNHLNSAEDKKVICQYYFELLESDSDITMTHFALQHCLKERYFQKLVAKYVKYKETGIDTFHNYSGKPRKIDEEGSINLRRLLIDRQKAQQALKYANFIDFYKKEALETMKRKGNFSTDVNACKRTIKTFMNSIEVTENEGQFKTKARIVAEADPRNTLTMTAMCYAYCENKHPAMIFNWDATQFMVSSEGNTLLLKVKSTETERIPLTAESAGETDFFIKLYHFHNAAGNPAPPVYCIADETMDAEDLHVITMIGIGNTAAINSFGYVAFTKTRCCNKEFYRWYAQTVVVPFVELCREAIGEQDVGISYKNNDIILFNEL
jgi:hypothetical protein